MKYFFGLIVIATLLMGGYLIMRGSGSGPTEESSAVSDSRGSNVSIVDGKQVIELRAKGGYLPKVSVAKAGMPTVLRVNTSGTFDCSSSIRMPSLKVSQNLPASGVTDIPLGTLASGTISGNCGMGMYPFQINVEN